MKIKNIFRTFAIVSLGASFTSCEDTLDVSNTQAVADQAIWSSIDGADAYITASYKIFTDDTQLKNDRSKFWDSYSDLTKSSSWDQYGHPYNQFLIQGLNTGEGGAGAFECWSSEYNRISTANQCLMKLHEYGTKHGEEFVKTREAEIRLCRAYSYFRLARVYGGVVIRTHESGANGMDDGAIESDIHRARATEAETYRFILDELQFAAENLPAQHGTTWVRGRATKAMAYGLISRIALYAKQWDEAAEAAKKCGEQKGVALDPSFAALFAPGAETSPEVIFCIEYIKGNVSLHHLWDMHNSPAGDSKLNDGGAWGEHQPTAELCDLYEWKDGTPFDWGTWDKGHADPFTDREPRFQATVLYNGAKWRGRTIEPYKDGADGFWSFQRAGSAGGKSCTGYFLRKFLQEDNMEFVDAKDASWTPDLVLRYGEVLLNRAEALAQSDFVANRSEILNCINALRKRVNLPDKTVSDMPDLEKCMQIIRDERAKELVGEGFRFWDLRRWGIAESVIDGKMMHGVEIVKQGNAYQYKRIDVDGGNARIYQERYNYFSIPLSERTNNKLCTNNPGW